MDDESDSVRDEACAVKLREKLNGTRIEYDLLDVAAENGTAIVFFVFTVDTFVGGARQREQRHNILREPLIQFPSDTLFARLALLAG